MNFVFSKILLIPILAATAKGGIKKTKYNKIFGGTSSNDAQTNSQRVISINQCTRDDLCYGVVCEDGKCSALDAGQLFQDSEHKN